MKPAIALAYPRLHKLADAASAKGQKRYLSLLAAELTIMCLAALASDLIHSVSFARVLASLTLAFMLAAFCIEVTKLRGVVAWGRVWTEGRAVAESVKTIAWQYMMRMPPFEGERAETELLETLPRLLPTSVIRQLEMGAEGEEITEYMRQIRNSNWEQRRQEYLEMRLDDQVRWYGERARLNKRRAQSWFWAALLTQVASACFAVQLIIRPESHWNLISFFTTIAAASVGWSQAKRHEELQTTYQIATEELAEIRQAEVATAETEDDFLHAVASSEGAISREHTVWRAKCGVLPRRSLRSKAVP
jgi:SMODS and SLOG-associating 2TM effector domain 3/SMODS and SLOG-associating 2TM effector domain 1